MKPKRIAVDAAELPPFDRHFFDSDKVITRIGDGALGGKASGLAFMKNILADRFGRESHGGFTVTIPRLVVITTSFYDRFLAENDLAEAVTADRTDDHIAHAFQQARLPADLVGDLRALIASVRTPLAIRSSSLLEDAMHEPFAGVYATKMIPNNQPDIDTRFRKLVEAIKFVYASTFFAGARQYMAAVGRTATEGVDILFGHLSSL